MLARPVLAILTAALSLVTCDVHAKPVDFERDVAPLFQSHCIRCHSDTERSGDLSLATADDLAKLEIVVAGKPAESSLLDAITALAGERPAMPKEGTPLAPEQVDTIREWIEQGAVWPEQLVVQSKSKADASWWSLQPLAAMEPPSSGGETYRR